jgi:hypothetical protein
MARFQKLLKNLFLTLYGHNIRWQQRKLSKFLMLTAGPRDKFPRWHCSRRNFSVCSILKCPDVWLQCSVSFVRGLKKTHHTRIMYFFKPCTNSCYTVITHLDIAKWRTQKASSCDAILETGSAALQWAWEANCCTVPTADSVCCTRVGWEIHFFNQLLKLHRSFVYVLYMM